MPRKRSASVRRLHRTSLPIPYANGVYPPKPLIPIFGGILTFESDWKPCFGQPLADALQDSDAEGRLDLGCVAAHGYFSRDAATGAYDFQAGGKPATAFLLKLIAMLQFSGTVPMIDVRMHSGCPSRRGSEMMDSVPMQSWRGGQRAAIAKELGIPGH